MKRVVVIGAAGGVGLTLSELLHRVGGYSVRASVAPWDAPERVSELKRYASGVVVGDITKAGDVAQMLRGMDVVVNCAAALADKHEKEVQYQVNVLGNDLLIRAAKQMGLKQMIVVSTAGVATGLGQEVPDDEQSPFRKHLHNYHIWSKIENEKNLAAVSREIGFPCVLLRPASIYGPHMTFRWGEIISYLKKGAMYVFDDPRAHYPLIHERDLARAIELSIRTLTSLSQNEAIIISSDEPLTLSGIVNFIAREMGYPPAKRLPYPAVLAASYLIALVPMNLRPKQLQLISPWSVREYRQGHAYVTDKAKRLLGFTAEVRFEDGMREVLRNYNEKGIRHWG